LEKKKKKREGWVWIGFDRREPERMKMTMKHIDLLPRTSSLDPEHEPAAEIPSGMKMAIKSQQIS
jgi:hypothetical protein